jgi:hypothetical protein
MLSVDADDNLHGLMFSAHANDYLNGLMQSTPNSANPEEDMERSLFYRVPTAVLLAICSRQQWTS